LTPAAAQVSHPSLGLSQNLSSLYIDRNSQYTSKEPGADTLPQPSNNSEYNCGESVPELEKDILQAFKEQGDLLSASTLKNLILQLLQP
jgi:hypothetical protein